MQSGRAASRTAGVPWLTKEMDVKENRVKTFELSLHSLFIPHFCIENALCLLLFLAPETSGESSRVFARRERAAWRWLCNQTSKRVIGNRDSAVKGLH